MDVLIAVMSDESLNIIAQTILHFFWQGAAISAILFALLKWYFRSTHVRYWASLAALTLMAICPVITYSLLSNQISDVYTGAVVSIADTLIPDTTVVDTDIWLRVSPVIALGWFCGVSVLSIRLIYETIGIQRLPRVNTAPAPAALQQVFDEVKQRLRISFPVTFMVSERVDVPMVVGWLKPFVLLPVGMTTGLSHHQLEMLIAHELSHVKRHDFAVNFLQTLVEIVLFFHPSVRWVSEQIRIEREHCCDDAAIALCGNHHAYARALVEAESVRQQSIPQLAMAATAGDLKTRVLRIVDNMECTNNKSVNTLSAMLAGLTGMALMAAITFSDFYLEHRTVMGYQDVAQTLEVDEEVVDATSLTQAPLIVAKAKENNLTFYTKFFNSQAVEPQATGIRAFRATEIEDTTTSLAQVNAEVSSVDVDLADNARDSLSDTSSRDDSQAATLAQVSAPQSQERADKAQPADDLADDGDLVASAATSTQSDLQPERRELKLSSSETKQRGVEVARLETARMKPGAIEAKSELIGQTQATDGTISLARVEKPAIDEPVTSVQKNAERLLERHDYRTVEAPITIAHAHQIVQPRILHKRVPSYPRQAANRGLEAEVRVSFLVNEDGKVESLEFNTGINGSFKRAVRKALKDWRFEPGKVNGEYASMQVEKIFQFTNPFAEKESAKPLTLTGSRIAR